MFWFEMTFHYRYLHSSESNTLFLHAHDKLTPTLQELVENEIRLTFRLFQAVWSFFATFLFVDPLAETKLEKNKYVPIPTLGLH